MSHDIRCRMASRMFQGKCLKWLMLFILLLECCSTAAVHTKPHFLQGQLESELMGAFTDNLDSGDNGIVDPSGQVIRIKGPNQERFLQELIMEAGRHVLYPEEGEEISTESSQHPSYLQEDAMDYSHIKEISAAERNLKSSVICQQKCHHYKPVCGSDRKVYESECHLLKSNCGYNVSVSQWEACRGRHYLCPASCLDISDPVCGPDGKLYRNICIMRKRNCGRLIAIKPLKSCYFQSGASKGEESCPEECREIYSPLCGSDGAVYYNECFFKMKTCGTNVEQVDMENCSSSLKCPEVCIPLYDPVCGSDGKLYMNHCTMLKENCANQLKLMPRDFCVVS